MGYTHYWRRPPRLSPDSFARAVADIQQVLEKLPVALAGPDSTRWPLLAPGFIIFNGIGDDAHEPFAVCGDEPDPAPGGLVFSWCKTCRKPYDLAVQVALIILDHHFGDCFHVTSDGSATEWDRARSICQEHLGYGENFALKSAE